MNIDKETEAQVQELQMIEQNLQNILMQKQALQLELTEVENAIKELAASNSDVYKIAGQIMLKANKEDLEKDLKEKKDLAGIKAKTLDSQEEELSSAVEKLREEVLKKIQPPEEK